MDSRRMLKIITAFCILPALTQGYVFEPINSHVGAFVVKVKDAYVSHSRWRLLYHYDLADFYDNVNLYKDSLGKLDEICNKLEEKNENDQCLALVKKHRSFLEDMNLDIEYLEIVQGENKKKYRTRRAAPFGSLTSYVFKPIFGIMDEDDAEQLSTKINELAENQQAYHTILEHNLSIISQTIEATNDTMFEFRMGMEAMNSFIGNMTEKLKTIETDVNLHLNFGYISDLATNIKIEYTKAMTVIKKVIQNKLVGEFTEIMTYRRLAKDLSEIEQEFDDTRVKLLSDPLELQDSIMITGAIIRRKLLIELEVPIIDRSLYTLVKIIRFPMRNEDAVYVFDIPQADYLIQSETKQYIPMPTSDLAHCNVIARKKFLCFPQRETHYADDTSCESNILFDKRHSVVNTCVLRRSNNINWIIGLDNNQHYVSPKNNITIIERCIGQQPIKSILSKPGILRLDENCALYTDKIIVYPKYVRTRAGIADLPVTNRTQGIRISDMKNFPTKLTDLPPLKTVFKNFYEDFDINNELTKYNQTLQKIHKIEPVERHVLRNATIGTTLIVVTIIACWLIRRCICKCK